MGVYYRKFRKTGRRIWWLSYMVGGRQVFESSHSTSKRFAEKLLAIRKAEVAAGRYDMLKPSPKLGEWAEKYLDGVAYANTKKRYAVSKENLIRFFGDGLLLSGITAGRINDFIRHRRAQKVKSATINRDLRFAAQLLKQAERERFLNRSPFDLAKFFLSEKDRRKPYILTWEQEKELLEVARPRIRILVVLGSETGMRTGEIFSLRWKQDIDFLNDVIRVQKSKSQSGSRVLPMSVLCKAELLKWRSLIGAESEFVFPSYINKRHRLQGGRKAWASTLKAAGIPYFPIYNLRHLYASRLNAAGVPALTIAALLGHSSTQIVPRYAQVLDQNRIDAMKRLEVLRQSEVSGASSHRTYAVSTDHEIH